jgi:uncharacterized protein (TIGR02271 family)
MPTRKKHTPVVGLFETRLCAERAVEELKAAGFDESKIGMVYRDAEGHTVKTGTADETHAAEGAAVGAAAGAGAAVLGSLAVSFIPIAGPILAVGPLAAALVSAAAGAAAGGLAGGLIGWGIPEEDAAFYEKEVSSGRYLLTVDANGRAADARAAMLRRGGFDRTGWDAVRADRANTLSEGGFRDDSGRVIQLKEEHLRADKQRVSAGEVKVRKEVRTEQQQITVPVECEEVVVERRPASGAASGDLRAEEIRIPVSEERVTVSKEPVVREEVVVGKRKVKETRTVGGTVRKEDAVVEATGEAKVRNARTGRKS